MAGMRQPLFIISFISSAHNDALMMGFALAGIYAATTANRHWSGEWLPHCW